jgi:hypothetical protein
MAIINFDATKIAPDEGRTGALPAGWYKVAVDQADMKPTSAGTGSYLNTRFTVLDGAHRNAKFYHRFNMTNPNALAVDIGLKQLSALCHAVQMPQVQDTAMLHNRPLFVKIKIGAATGGYEASNEITAFRDINDQAAIAGFSGVTAMAAPAAVRPAAPPPPPPGAAPAAWAQAPQAPAQPAAAPAPAQQAPAAWAPPAAAQPWAAPAQAAPVAQQPAPVAQPVAEQAAQPAWANAAPVQAEQAAAAQAQAAATPAAVVPAVTPPWATPPVTA